MARPDSCRRRRSRSHRKFVLQVAEIISICAARAESLAFARRFGERNEAVAFVCSTFFVVYNAKKSVRKRDDRRVKLVDVDFPLQTRSLAAEIFCRQADQKAVFFFCYKKRKPGETFYAKTCRWRRRPIRSIERRRVAATAATWLLAR